MPDILFTRDGAVATITLNRPDKLNSFRQAMHTELSAALTTVEADQSVRVLVITGAGRAFCAGQDLADLSFVPGAMSDLGELLSHFNSLVRRLQALPMPVIASVNGAAAGAGANLALACDIVLAARSASFLQAFSKIGLVPDSGGTWFLPQRLGMARAMGLALLAEKLPAEKAEQWGLIWKCVEDDTLAAETTQLAQHLAAQPTKALGMIKAALHASADNSLDAQLDLERALQHELGQSADYAEGVNAFLQKRAAQFAGR